MAFDIQPPKRKRISTPSPQPSIKRADKAFSVSENKKQAVTKSPAAAVPTKTRTAKKPKKAQTKQKARRAGRWGVVFTWLILFIVLGVVGYMIWQEEIRNASLQEEAPAPAGVIETFPSASEIDSKSKEADKNQPEPQNNSEKEFSKAEQEFSAEFEKLKTEGFTPPAYDRSKWEQINSYLSDF